MSSNSMPRATLSRLRPVTTLLIKRVALLLVFVSLMVSSAMAQGFSAALDLTAQDTYQAMQDDSLILIDVRTPEEWVQTGIAEGAHPISMLDRGFLSQLAQLQEDNPGKTVAFICASGRRSALVQAELERRGYENIFSVYGGTTGSRNAPGWIREGLPISPWTPS